MKRKGLITLKSKSAPVVELDSEARAAYVRFSDARVVRTDPIATEDCIVTADFDVDGEIVGLELIGVTEFGVGALLKKSGAKAPSQATLLKTRYVPASLH